MRQELDEALVADFPKLYADRYNKNSSMYWGFACEDGWEPIIRRLSAQLEAGIKKLPPRQRRHCKATQVKEKFGSLNFHLSNGSLDMYALIQAAEEESMRTCETCGSPGQLRTKRSWYRIACDECDKKRNSSGPI